MSQQAGITKISGEKGSAQSTSFFSSRPLLDALKTLNLKSKRHRSSPTNMNHACKNGWLNCLASPPSRPTASVLSASFVDMVLMLPVTTIPTDMNIEFPMLSRECYYVKAVGLLLLLASEKKFSKTVFSCVLHATTTSICVHCSTKQHHHQPTTYQQQQ